MVSGRTIRGLTVGGMAVALSLALNGNVGAAGPPASAASFMRTAFTWSGNGSDDAWDTYQNWCPSGRAPCANAWPDGADDNATIPSNAATTWDVNLVTETIGDLSVEESVNFDGDGGAVTLKCKTVTFAGGSAGITVKWTADAIISDDG